MLPQPSQGIKCSCSQALRESFPLCIWPGFSPLSGWEYAPSAGKQVCPLCCGFVLYKKPKFLCRCLKGNVFISFLSGKAGFALVKGGSMAWRSWPQLTGIVPQSQEGQTFTAGGERIVDGQDWEGHRGAPAAEVSANNS